MKDKLLLHGGAAFNDHELLEMLLYNVIPRQNTNPLAHSLINAFGSIDKVFEASYDALLAVDGVGKKTAAYVILLSESYKRITERMNDGPIKVPDSTAAADIILPEFLGLKEERLYLLALDKDCNLKYKGFLNSGGEGAVKLYAREIVNKCIAVNAVRVYLAHNHPSGIAAPSKSDLKSSVATENLLTHMHILMEDHFIIADNDYVSMKESGMLLRQLSKPELKRICES